jgi:hypothetical protein
MGLDDALAQASLRFGLGRFNTQEEVDTVVERVAVAVARLREISPLYQASPGAEARTTNGPEIRPGGFRA